MNLIRFSAVALLLQSDCFAGIKDFFRDAKKTAVQTVTAPTQTLVNAVQAGIGNKPVGAILDPAKSLAASTGETVISGGETIANAQNQIYRSAQELASKAGPGGDFVFDVATFSQRYKQQWEQAQTQVVGNVLQGQNPLQFVGIPLAAAIRAGRERHIGNAKPLPEAVKKGLAGFYAAGVLERARWTVGKLDITLPNGIGKVRKFGDSFAVVVDDVIVFNEAPPAFEDDPWWWGHEVTHVEQYQKLGVEEFARRYVFSGGADLEGPADKRGTLVRENAKRNGTATAKAFSITIPDAEPSRPLLPSFALDYKIQNPPQQVPPPEPQVVADPAIIRCVFPGDLRPFDYVGTKSGKIIVVDRTNGQWLHIGYALPAQIQNVAWHYQAGNVFYDVLPDGRIFQRNTPYGPVQVGFVSSL